MNFLEQLRKLDANDIGRWPLLFRALADRHTVRRRRRRRHLRVRRQAASSPSSSAPRQKEQELKATFEARQRKAANFDAYKVQLDEMQRSFGAMLRQLPGKTEVPNLLVDISQTGLAAGLEEQLFQPSPEVRRDFYAELPIRIRLLGTFHELGNFVSGIAALPRIVTLHDLSITPEAKTPATASSCSTSRRRPIAISTRRPVNDESLQSRPRAARRRRWLAACTGGMGDLEQYVQEVKARPGGRIEPLPEIKPYESFAYAASTLRSPVRARHAGRGRLGRRRGAGVRPDTQRNREFLEQFPLDTLRMVGTLEAGSDFLRSGAGQGRARAPRIARQSPGTERRQDPAGLCRRRSSSSKSSPTAWAATSSGRRLSRWTSRAPGD